MSSASSEVIPFGKTLAHPPGDLLTDHLKRVAEAARQSLQPPRGSARRIALVAGLCHDVGKATHFFQVNRLQHNQRSELTNHSLLGAIWAWWAAASLTYRERLSVVVAVLRHHGRLAESWAGELRTVLFAARHQRAVHEQLAAMDIPGAARFLCDQLKEYHDYGLQAPEALTTSEQLIASLPRSALSAKRVVGDLGDTINFLAGFGALVGSDRVDTALAGSSIHRLTLPQNAVSHYKTVRFGQATDAINKRREEIGDAIETTWGAHEEARLFTLTSPTGSGKTLAVLNGALKRRASETEGRPRIIYCLPFTSVIDQNARVFADVLRSMGIEITSDILLKHHHLSDKGFRTSDQGEYESDGAGRLLTESWQSEVVVTTFYQLLHTLLSTKARHLQRAGVLSGAIVILDEVQAIPLRYWKGIGKILSAAAQNLHTTFVLCTATRPLIFSKEISVELLPEHIEHFRAMTRTRLQCHHREPVSLRSFGDHLANELTNAPHSCLVILNRKRAVADLCRQLQAYLPNLHIRALSTNLTPADRIRRIEEIQSALSQEEPVVLVSTQLVEAGVDFSFHEVHRDLAPLDSIVQAAGRCNRSGDERTHSVHVWQLVDESNTPLWRHVYDGALIDATVGALGNRTEFLESEFLQLSERYFQACVDRAEDVPIDEWLAKGLFGEIADKFKLIERLPKQGYFISRSVEDERTWQTYCQWQEQQSPETYAAFRRIERSFMEQIVEVYDHSHDSGSGDSKIRRAGSDRYDPEFGLTVSEDD